MDSKTIVELGFDVCGGKIDYRGKNYGFLIKGGEAVLTDEGRELAAALAGRQIMASAPVHAEPEKRRGRPLKAEAKLPVPETKELASEDIDLDSLLAD
jgi:hypothetical protein